MIKAVMISITFAIRWHIAAVISTACFFPAILRKARITVRINH